MLWVLLLLLYMRPFGDEGDSVGVGVGVGGVGGGGGVSGGGGGGVRACVRACVCVLVARHSFIADLSECYLREGRSSISSLGLLLLFNCFPCKWRSMNAFFPSCVLTPYTWRARCGKATTL